MTQEQLDYLASIENVATRYAVLSGDNSPVDDILENGTDEQKHWVVYNIPGGAAMDDTISAYVESIRTTSSASIKTESSTKQSTAAASTPSIYDNSETEQINSESETLTKEDENGTESGKEIKQS